MLVWRRWSTLLLLGTVLLPARALAVTFVFNTPISGDSVSTTLTLNDVPGGGGVDVTVSIPAGQGDLLGLFGNVTQEAMLPSMTVESPDGLITQWQFSANNVVKVRSGNTMAPVTTWDWGVRIDRQGAAAARSRPASFRLGGSGLDVTKLVGASTAGWVFGVRIQATNGPRGLPSSAWVSACRRSEPLQRSRSPRLPMERSSRRLLSPSRAA